jgi:hypothetical protein
MIINIIIITIVIIIFIIVINYQVEHFTDKDTNYINPNSLPPDYNHIYSTLPYDIKAKNDSMNIYDYGNDELNEKFISIFDIDLPKQINIIEGIEWTKWMTVDEIKYFTNLYNYYNNAIQLFNNKLKHKDLKLPNDNNDFKIIKHNLVRYKTAITNSNINLLDIELLIYRIKKPLARHIKVIVVCNGDFTSFLLVKIIGVVNENILYNNKVISYNELDNCYNEFIPERIVDYDIKSYVYDTEDKILHSEISNNLYNKLLKDLTY